MINAATVCDVHQPTMCHTTPAAFPPSLAIGVDRAVSGADFLLAFTLGVEIAIRVGIGSNYPAFRANGWHSPGVWGPFGSAAASGKLLGLDSYRMRNAFGLAGSQSAGTFAAWGSPTVKFHQSRGSLSGYLAANLADAGFQSSVNVLTAEDGGLYRACSDGGRPSSRWMAWGKGGSSRTSACPSTPSPRLSPQRRSPSSTWRTVPARARLTSSGSR